MKTKEKQLVTLTATFIFAALVMGLVVYGLAKENDNMRREKDRLEYILRECKEK